MNRSIREISNLFVFGLCLVSTSTNAAQQPASVVTASIDWTTDGPAVFQLVPGKTQIVPGALVSFAPPPTNLPPEIRIDLVTFQTQGNVIVTNMDRRFDHYAPESLNNLVWTNFMANTNGKSMAIWSIRQRTLDWPARPAEVRWNPKSLIWGMKGMTAICPCWSGEGPPGWIPITALTRRHGYLLGHGMKEDGVSFEFAGSKVWFLTANNHIVTRTIRRQLSRLREVSHRDYTMVIFDSDLPDSIEPMRVVHSNEIFAMPHCRYPYYVGAPNLLFKTEQGGNVSADEPGFAIDTMKGGDSGSPNMLPLPGELVFWNGRTTSGPSPEMQADMDQLCRLERLDPAKYQLQYVDLSKYPTY